MSEEPEIMGEKYQLRGQPGDNTVTLEWLSPVTGKPTCKPATPAEIDLVRQVGSLVSALRISMRRNALHEQALRETRAVKA